MKKILLVTFEYPVGKNYCGGVGQMVARCRQSLVHLGYEVYVLISAEFRKKYPVQVLEPDNNLTRYSSFFDFQKKIKLAQFDMIIQHFVNCAKDLERVKRLKGKRPKVVYHFHSILRREKDSGFKIFNKFLIRQEKMIEIADHIICPSKYEHDNFNRYFPAFSEKISLVENMFDIFPKDRAVINDFKKQYGIRPNDIVSIYVGRLETAKGAHILVENLNRILSEKSNQKIFIIGKTLDASIHRKLMKVCKKYPNKVFYIKYLQKRQLFQLYYLSHIYINSSLSESFSLSTYEGAFCRNALLLNTLPVFDRFKKGALFFQPYNNNGNGFLHKYVALIKNKALRERLGKSAQRAANSFLMRRDLDDDFKRFINVVGK